MRYRHGDLSFKPIQKLPKDLKKVNKHDSFVLAEGETTGHKHLLTAERMEILQAPNGKFYLSLPLEGSITHEEHKKVILPPGLYEMNNEREKDWFSLSVRRVID